MILPPNSPAELKIQTTSGCNSVRFLKAAVTWTNPFFQWNNSNAVKTGKQPTNTAYIEIISMIKKIDNIDINSFDIQNETIDLK